jgi:formate dehydrogenase major subunit
MLQYGVPEYRLPKKILQKEIASIEKTGVVFQNNTKIGRDVSLEYLRNNYDAVIVAVGAWESTGLRCKGEELDGVLSSVDFLKDVHAHDFTGKKVAVVGGGDIAMDACRTAVRLKASEVYNIYRRTKNEMPANITEITEAEEEGVIFKNLANPIEIIGENGKTKFMRLQIMELGDPDASGRRSPVPVAGKEETIEVDNIIVAIGSKTDKSGFEELEFTKWGTVLADENTFQTNLEGVFAIGDAANKGADIAITAIGEAKRAAEIIDRYLNLNVGHGDLGVPPPYYLSKTEKTREDFLDKPKLPRVKNKNLTEEDAKKEASRCLACGCHAFAENKCKLIDYAGTYKIQPGKFDGHKNRHDCETIQDFIRHNPDKCILCGLCVRICREAEGKALLGFADRGFDTFVKPAIYINAKNSCGADCCVSCGAKCVEACPTGALEKLK